MERAIIDLPCNLFNPVMRDWHLDARGRSAGDGVTGDGQVVYANRARWVGRLDFEIVRRDRVLVWSALMAKMRGRVNILRVCLCAPYGILPKHVLQAGDPALSTAGIPHDDDALFDDGTGYDYQPTAPTVGSAAAGASTMLINATPVGDRLEPGHWFSIDDWLYRCTGIWGSGSSTTIAFEPPLRRSVSGGTDLCLNAKTLMAFESDGEGRAQLFAGKSGQSTLNLVEWTNRA